MKFSEYYKNFSNEQLLNDLNGRNNLTDYRDDEGKHILDWVISKNRDIRVINYLLAVCGSNISMGVLRKTPLMVAVISNNVTAFNAILDYENINLLIVDKDGWNVLHHAVNENRMHMVRNLTNNMTREQVAIRTGKGIFNGLETPLVLAAKGGYGNIADLLIGKNQSLLEIQDQKELTPLYLAIRHRKLGVLKVLLKSGANINARHNGQNCIQYAQGRLENYLRDNSNLSAEAREIVNEINLYQRSPDNYRQRNISNYEKDQEANWFSAKASDACTIM